MEVIEVNRKVLGTAVVLMTVAMLVSPVLAIGPENALGKNPNLDGPYYYGYDQLLRDGAIDNIRVTMYPVPIYQRYLDARYFKINKAIVITDPSQVGELENKWLYLSSPIMYAYFVSEGMPEGFAAFLAFVFWPEGVYYKFNVVGQ
jgi:hypothetical protein